VGATVGALIGGGITALETFVVSGPRGVRLRRLPPPVFFLLMSVIWVVIIVASLQLGPRIYGMSPYPEWLPEASFGRDVGFSFVVSLVVNYFLRLRALVGPRVFRDRVRRRPPWYRERFGVTPAFRIGIHGGRVVASAVGDEKREIVYFGDTINTAARLEQLCKERDRDLIVSGELLSRMPLLAGVTAESLGGVALRGRREPMEASALFDVG